MMNSDNTREPNGYFQEDILRQDLLCEALSRQEECLSESEQRLLAHVYASLTNGILDEIEYLLTYTFPEMQIERDRQWTLSDLVAQTLLDGPTDVLMIVWWTVVQLAEVGDTPWAVGAYLNVLENTWQVEIEMDYPYDNLLPYGTGRVLFDTMRYASAADHFAAALEARRPA
jgi:hypothetical protein